MSFGSPDYFALALLVAVIAGGLMWLRGWRRRALLAFGGPRAVAAHSGVSLRNLLLVAAAVLVVLAAARPQWGQREFSRAQEGVDVVVALDISQSMTATDVQPSRMAIAQSEITALIETMQGSRFGLVFFAGSAILRSPLSTDNQALAGIVNRADREPGLTRAGSDLGAALNQAANILEGSESEGRAIVLVTDGEDFGAGATDAARALVDNGIVLFTAGVGTAEGATLLEPVGLTGQTRTKVDPATGRPVITRLDRPRLEGLAAAAGGTYVNLGGEGRSLLQLRDHLSQLRQAPTVDETQKVPIERFQWFAGAAIALLALSLVAPDRLPRLPANVRAGRRSGRAVATMALALSFGVACSSADPVRDSTEQANGLYNEGRYEEALLLYESLLAQRPDLPELAYNTGNTLHRMSQFERAVEESRRALPPSSTALGVNTYFALGNHFLALEQLEDAYEAYRSALLLDPGDADSKHNLEVVLLRMNPVEQQPQPQGADPGGADPGEEQTGEQQPAGGGQPAPAGGDAPEGGQAAQQAAESSLRDLQEALAGIEDTVSFEEAIRILDLLQEQRQRPLPAQAGPGGGPDY